jgi:hypothetical protein
MPVLVGETRATPPIGPLPGVHAGATQPTSGIDIANRKIQKNTLWNTAHDKRELQLAKTGRLNAALNRRTANQYLP